VQLVRCTASRSKATGGDAPDRRLKFTHSQRKYDFVRLQRGVHGRGMVGALCGRGGGQGGRSAPPRRSAWAVRNNCVQLPCQQRSPMQRRERPFTRQAAPGRPIDCDPIGVPDCSAHQPLYRGAMASFIVWTAERTEGRRNRRRCAVKAAGWFADAPTADQCQFDATHCSCTPKRVCSHVKCAQQASPALLQAKMSQGWHAPPCAPAASWQLPTRQCWVLQDIWLRAVRTLTRLRFGCVNNIALDAKGARCARRGSRRVPRARPTCAVHGEGFTADFVSRAS
jgi:hypothetical protein